ncbi:MAG: lycopene cyclase domain-containing protein [Micrococcaceae bacterium]|uniref:lycopene cyclase domain-containing protein n=1 Tax=Arthrobacter sp. AOP36-A1-22 TaxID=3457684 RepID=UPI002656F4C0|nr:lycopene cyclase domain-containing protein [Micrococcaceae bacterium]MDN5824015.1 lycopene cyclase domain-containing protein [Micrococcaceae bacterium]MDN5878364.1 lycopene cyclase domain-containing protein [Micrococcaceae bacterium]MDN5885921.1 lycopene cyclase domain-containing protein [Micrococcaceae bacterium]MDN5906042.1 lycopene cyclase domain-containing protein [Micrococcaceae bacterium]
MSYLELNYFFLGLSLLTLLWAILARRLDRRRMTAMLVGVFALLILTAVFDNVMIGSGLFDYSSETLAGPRVGLAPLEDFAYPLGAAILLPSAWLLLDPRPRKDP